MLTIMHNMLVGMQPDAFHQIFALKLQIQPVFPLLLRFSLRMNQMHWFAFFLGKCENSYLGSISLELVLYSTVEDVYNGKCSMQVFERLIEHLKPFKSYRELIAHVARKMEPNRLPLLFPAAGVIEELFQTCLMDGELYTAAKYLVLLGTDELPLCEQLTQYAQDLTLASKAQGEEALVEQVEAMLGKLNLVQT